MQTRYQHGLLIHINCVENNKASEFQFPQISRNFKIYRRSTKYVSKAKNSKTI